MTADTTISAVFCTALLVGLVMATRRGRKRSESLVQESFKQQEEAQKLLKDILVQQAETNRLLKELIEDNRKK